MFYAQAPVVGNLLPGEDSPSIVRIHPVTILIPPPPCPLCTQTVSQSWIREGCRVNWVEGDGGSTRGSQSHP